LDPKALLFHEIAKEMVEADIENFRKEVIPEKILG
jgi:hypothetical protein